jgi:hypothetical protein
VCYAADYEGNEGLYAALESIHDEIARLNLLQNKSELTENDSKSPATSSVTPNELVPIVRGQNDPPVDALAPNRGPISSGGATTTIGPASPPREKPAGLNQAEQAAWDEIIKRARESEVIIIVRPKEPGGQSEVITLDNVSPEFVEAIAGREREPESAVSR